MISRESFLSRDSNICTSPWLRYTRDPSPLHQSFHLWQLVNHEMLGVTRPLRAVLRVCCEDAQGQGGERAMPVLGCSVSIEVVHLHRRGHPRSPRGTVMLHTHSRSGHLTVSSLPPLLSRAVPSPTTLGPTASIFSLAASTRVGIAYFRAHRAHCSCASRLYRRGMHKSQCCANAAEYPAASCNNIPC